MAAPIRLSKKAKITHVMVVVKDGDAGGMVPMPLAAFAKLFVTGGAHLLYASPQWPAPTGSKADGE